MSKITKSTLKSLVRKNAGKLFIKVASRFDGMVDGVRDSENQSFSKCMPADGCHEHNLGIQGAWLVLGSNDWFTAYEDDKFIGIEVYNCCGNFTLAVKK